MAVHLVSGGTSDQWPTDKIMEYLLGEEKTYNTCKNTWGHHRSGTERVRQTGMTAVDGGEGIE